MPRSISTPLDTLLRTARQFIDREVIPLEPHFLVGSSEELAPGLSAARAKAKAAGLWAPLLPENVGGSGMRLSEYAHLSEELGRTPLGNFACNAQAPDLGNMELLTRYGNDDQKERWLKPLVEGKIRSAFAMTEPGHPGSNPTWLSTTAIRDGDEYVINGDKWFTTGADGAALMIVMAVTNPDAGRYRRASQIIVSAGTPGLTTERNTPVMGEAGSGWSSHSEVSFNDCRVPVTNRIGGEGDGFVLAQERLGPGRIHHTMRWIGICERAIELMCAMRSIGRSPLAGRWQPARWSSTGSLTAEPRPMPLA